MIEMLRERAVLLRELRDFFDQRGFLEVQPPCLSRDCVVDAYLDPITVETSQLKLSDRSLPERMFLQTSPESAMKRMLVEGAPSIYSLGPVFRSGEQGPLHNVEFCMLEWYQLGAGMAEGIELLGKLAASVLGSEGYDVRTYRQVFSDHLGVDPITAPVEALRDRVGALDSALAASLGNDRDGLLDVLLSQRLQDRMGSRRPLIVQNYPLSQAALARACEDDPACAARFELFAGGLELANGYDELLDADELVRRYQANNERRTAAGRAPLAVDTTLVDAMRAGLPPCTGVALGVDRLLMQRTGCRSIREVMPLPIDRA